jgi:signal transduction histidine kinase
MNNNKVRLTTHKELRHIAEERMRNHPLELSLPQSPEATQQIIHELGVHQIEIEIQNEELRESRNEIETALEKYEDLYESAPIGYFTLDRNGIIGAVNLVGADLLRIMRSLIIGRSFEQFISIECRSTFIAFLETVFNSPGEKNCQFVILNNVALPINVQIGATASKSGKECRLAVMDISGQQPITRTDNDADTSNDFSTVESGKIELELSVCSLREALDAAMTILQEKIPEGCPDINLELALEVDERIVADQWVLTRIMLSLLANAVRLTPTGESVGVSITRDGNLLRTTVADSGNGISETDIRNLFKAVTQPETPNPGKLEDPAFSLAIIRPLVELQGGTLWVESEVGSGSRFSFTIPLRNSTGIT